jgi:hypothetical protein
MLFLNSSNIFPELQFFEDLLPPGVGLVLYLSPFLFIAILLCRCFADRFSVVLIQFNNGIVLVTTVKEIMALPSP